MKRLLIVLVALVLAGCAEREMSTAAELPAGRFQKVSAIEGFDNGGISVRIFAVCDTSNGNLLYVSCGTHANSIAVVVGGCSGGSR